MTEPDFTHRYAEHGAGHALPVHVGYAETAPAAPATPTERLIVDGVELAPASRLLALASIRDQHRAAQRAIADRRQALREQADDLTRRSRMLDQHKYTGMSATAVAERGQIEADLLQVRDALRALDAEAATASEAFGSAQGLLHGAIRFARDAGAVIPVVLQGEVR